MTLSVTSGNEVTPYLMEWAPFNASIDIPNLAIFLAMAGLAFVSGFRLSPAKSLFALAMLYMFLAHSRFAYLFFAIVPVIVAPDIARQFPSLSIEQWQRQALDSLESQLARTYRLVAVALGGILMCCIALVCTVLPVQRDPSLAVEEALGFARANSLRGHVLNTYNLGGSLILEGTPTYIDGRSDQLFQSGFFLRDMASMQSPQILAKVLAQYDIQWTLLRPADGRIKMLDATTGWKRVYEDQYAIIHAKQP
jgi:hypothetical protein